MPRFRAPGLVGLGAFVACAVCCLGCSKGRLTADASPPSGDASFNADIRVAVDGSGDSASSVDAPQGSCPPSAPASGSGCGGPGPGAFCQYADPQPSTCVTRCECRGITWMCDRVCTTGACPANVPSPGLACASNGLTCVFPSACGDRQWVCDAFEIGAPPRWQCAGNCSCDGSDLYCGGGVTCHGTDICVIVNGCGGPVNCQDTIDGGQCPPGSTLNPDCPTGRPGCVPDCTPPPPTCAPQPASCTVGISCGCLPAGFCPIGGCTQAEGRVAFCANQ